MNSPMSPGGNALLTLKEIARQFAVSRRTVEREIARGNFPRPIKIGHASRFEPDAVAAYLERNRSKS